MRVSLNLAVLLSFILVINAIPIEKDEASTEAPVINYRLPLTIVPVSYDLTLTTHVGEFGSYKGDSEFKFEGAVAIKLQVLEDNTEEIVLHASDLTITEVKIKDKDGEQTIDLATIVNDNETDLIKIPTPKKLVSTDEYTLTIQYVGYHRADMQGFYRSSYLKDKNTRWIATTQFESSDARRAFPCFDEPGFKAKYSIKVRISDEDVKAGYHALSNTPLKGDPTDVTIGEKLFKEYAFEETPRKISSYLVAVIVSDFIGTAPATFKSTYGNDEDKEKLFTTWGQEAFISSNQGKLSQLAGVGAINVLTKNLKVGFGFPKIDQVGIPDFSAGAMENWGLTTYRERMLFYSENGGSASLKQSDVAVTTHELAHQWFGDLVTLGWWSDIWLNEGFATFFEYHASSEIKNGELDTSTWNYLGQMVTDEVQSRAFETDALESSRPLHASADNPDQIDANFDNIPYSKGGSVIRMWYHILGRDNFYKALNFYLTHNAEGVTEYTDLLAAFDEVVTDDPKPSTTFANWITKPGYPVVKVTLAKDGKSFEVTQKRFILKDSPKKEEGTKWYIPITYSTDDELNFGQTAPTHWLTDKDASVKIDLESNVTWIIVNNQQTGYYRVNYDENNWNALTAALKDKDVLAKIHETNRAQIINDVLTLARSTEEDHVSYTTALQLITYLKNETKYVPWKAAFNGFSFLDTKLVHSENYQTFKMLVLTLLEDELSKKTLNVGDKDAHEDRLQRAQIVSWACKLGHEDCTGNATQLFEDELADSKKKVHPDIRASVFCTGIRETNDSNWDAVWKLYQASTENVEQTFLLSVLGCTKNNDTMKKYLEKTLDANSGIRKQDLTAVFSAVYNGNPENVQHALQFLKNNLIKITQTYEGMNPIGGLLTGIAAKLGSEEDVQIMTDIKTQIENSEDSKVKAAAASAQSALDLVKSNQEWLKVKAAEIDKWLIAYAENGAPAITFSIVILISCLSFLFFQ